MARFPKRYVSLLVEQGKEMAKTKIVNMSRVDFIDWVVMKLRRSHGLLTIFSPPQKKL
jgi:hypothetical protein